MNKNFIKKLIITFIVIIVAILFLLFVNKISQDKNTNNTTGNEELNNSNVDIYDEDAQLGEPKLYITCEDQTITAYKFDGDFNEYFEQNLKEKRYEYQTNFNNLWEMIDSEPLILKINIRQNLTYQYSRYGYAKDDLEFNFMGNTFTFYEHGSYGCADIKNVYFKSNTPKNKIMPSSVNFDGKYIDAICINNQWLLYKSVAE